MLFSPGNGGSGPPKILLTRNNVVPVSYTHLDVYKRQEENQRPQYDKEQERRICAKIGRNPFENAKNVNDREEDRQQQQIGDAGEKQGRYPVPHVTQQVFGKSPVVFVPTAQQAGEQSDNDRDVIGGIFDCLLYTSRCV